MEEKIELTAELIYGFSEGLLAKNFDDRQRTPDFHIELWDYMCSDEEYVAVAAPRRHAKSTASLPGYAPCIHP